MRSIVKTAVFVEIPISATIVFKRIHLPGAYIKYGIIPGQVVILEVLQSFKDTDSRQLINRLPAFTEGFS